MCMSSISRHLETSIKCSVCDHCNLCLASVSASKSNNCARNIKIIHISHYRLSTSIFNRGQARGLNEGEVSLILGRSFCPFFILSYIFYIFKLLFQLKTGRSFEPAGRLYFSLVSLLLDPCFNKYETKQKDVCTELVKYIIFTINIWTGLAEETAQRVILFYSLVVPN